VGDGSIPHNPTVGEEPSPDPWNELQWIVDRGGEESILGALGMGLKDGGTR